MYRISDHSDWHDARFKIKNAMMVGLDLNNSIIPSAIITKIKPDGFEISIGGLRSIELKWSMLEHCWKDLCSESVYDQSILKSPFERVYLDCDCLNFVVRRLLKKSGLLSNEIKEQLNLNL